MRLAGACGPLTAPGKPIETRSNQSERKHGIPLDSCIAMRKILRSKTHAFGAYCVTMKKVSIGILVFFG